MIQQKDSFFGMISPLNKAVKISSKDHISYLKYHKSHQLEKSTKGRFKIASENLFKKTTSTDEKKRILFNFAHMKTPESFRVLDMYCKKPDKGLSGWAILAKEECRWSLENDLLYTEKDMVMTNLGGEGKRLRFYFIVSAKNRLALSETQKKIICNSFRRISIEKDSIIEEIKIYKNYARIKILIPMDVAPGELIEEGINYSNSAEKFLKFAYFITNTEKPDQSAIREYLEGLN